MTRKVFFFESLLIAAALVATAMLFPQFPAQVPLHWNLHMQPDSFGPKCVLYLIGPGVMALVMLMTWLFPWLSPSRFKIDGFWRTYHHVMLLVFGLQAYLYTVMLWGDCGRAIDMGRAMMAGLCLFVAAFGNVMGKLRRNFYLGVRTPWTLASERVWNDTHRFAAWIFVATGLLGLALSIIGLSLWAALVLTVAGVAPVVYSLVIYKQLERRGEIEDEVAHGNGEV